MADNISRPVASTSLPQAPTSNVSVRNIAAGGEAIARAGADIFDAATVWGQHRDEADVAAASASALEQIDQYEAELETADDPAKIRDGAEKRIAEIQSSAGAGIRSQAAQEAFQQRFGQAARAARVRVRQRAAKLEIDQGVASVERGLTALNGQAARAGSLAQRQILIDQAHAQLDGARSAGWISAVEAEKRKQDFAGGVDTDAALRLVTENPAAASRALAPDAGFFPHLDERSRIRLKHSADTELKRQAAERRAEAARARQDAKIDASLALQDLRTIVNSGAPVDPAVMREVDTLVRRAGDLRLSRSYADTMDRSRLNADIAGMSPADLKARREQLRRGIADGADAAEVEALAAVEGALKPVLAAEKAGAQDAATRGLKDIADLVDAGMPVDEGLWTAVATAVVTSGSDALARQYDEQAEKAKVAGAVEGRPPVELAAIAAEIAGQIDAEAPSPIRVRQLAAINDRLEKTEAAAVKDALKAYADGTRLRLPPVDWAGDAVEAALAQRAAVAAKAEDWHGQPSLLVTGGELKAIQHWFKKAQPLQQAALLATIAAVPGPAAQRTAEAVAGGDKAAYAAGALIRLGPQHQATAEAILQGSGAMREKLAVLPTDGVRADAWNKAMGNALDRPADARIRARYMAAAEALFAAEAPSRGISVDGLKSDDGVRQDGVDLLVESLQRVAGRWKSSRGDYGGIGEVNGAQIILPQDGDEDDVDDVLDALDQTNINAASRSGAPPVHVTISGRPRPVNPGQIRNMRLESVGEGIYRVYNPAGRGYLMDGADPKKLWLLDLSTKRQRNLVLGVSERPSAAEIRADQETEMLRQGVPAEALMPFQRLGGGATESRAERLMDSKPQ